MTSSGEDKSDISNKDYPTGLNDSTKVFDSSFKRKSVDYISINEPKQKENIQSQRFTEVLACDSQDSVKSDANEDTEESTSKMTSSSSKGNESSLRLELDITPDTKTKIPETQESIEEENIEVTSQSSTIEIESTGTTTEKGTLSPADGCEENSHKTSQQSDVKENIFGKSGQEDDHSLQISQDELFGSHISVVASTPQSNINSRLLLQKEITHIDMGNDDEMIPSSPEEKKKKSSGLSVGQGFLKRERVTLSLGRSSTKAEPSSASPDVVEICDDIIVISPVKNITRKDSELSDTGKRRIDFGAIECQHLESQETIYRGTHDKLESDVTKEKNLTKISGKYKQKLEVSVSTGRESSECGKDLDDDFDTEPVAINNAPLMTMSHKKHYTKTLVTTSIMSPLSLYVLCIWRK